MGRYRRRLGSRHYADFDPEKLGLAVEERRLRGRSYRYLSEKYKIPYSTIRRKVKNLHSKNFGGQTILSAEEEHRLVNNIDLACQWGFPLTANDVKSFR